MGRLSRTQIKAIKKISWGNDRFTQKYHPERLGKYLCKDQYFYVTDGNRIVKFNEDIPEIPLCGDWDYLRETVDIYRGYVNAKRKYYVPDIGVLRAMLSLKRKEIKNRFYIYTVGDNLPCVNLSYLIDIIDAMPHGSYIYAADLMSGLYFNSLRLPRMEAVLFPVPPPKDEEEQKLYDKITCHYSA